jgi:hypothetical protein
MIGFDKSLALTKRQKSTKSGHSAGHGAAADETDKTVIFRSAN